jgi:hypothetical protein
MSTTAQKYILGCEGSLALHFATALDKTPTVKLAQMDEDTVITFDTPDQATNYKDQLCVRAAAQERFNGAPKYILNNYSRLEVLPFIRELAVV